MHQGPATIPRNAVASVRRWLSGLMVALALHPATVLALEIQPVLAEVRANATTASFDLRNPRSTELRLQVDTLAWWQDGTDEHTAPSGDLIVVPRLVTLAPGGSQRVRIALRGGGPRSVEQAFRVRLRELPPPPAPGFMGLITRLEVTVPLFFLVDGATPAAPVFRAFRHPDGGIALEVENAGGHYFSFSSMQLVQADGALLAESRGPHYVLAGGGRHWRPHTHAVPAVGAPLRLVVTSRGREATHELTLE